MGTDALRRRFERWAAAAVAAGLVPIAHATDGAGSIRVPASYCGLVGLKPSQGRISAGPDGDESGIAVEGWLSRTVRDTAAMLDATHGPGVGDTVIAPAPRRRYCDELQAAHEPLRIGVLDHYPSGEPVHPICAAAVRQTGHLLERLGHHVDIGYPRGLADEGFNDLRALGAIHVASMLDLLTTMLNRPLSPDDVEPFTWARATPAHDLSALEHVRLLSTAVRLRRTIAQWWTDEHDLLLLPTVGDPPALIGTPPTARTTALTQPFNITGQPAISLPMARTSKGLPIGVQLVAAYGREDLLIRVAAQLEQAQPWTDLKPDPREMPAAGQHVVRWR